MLILLLQNPSDNSNHEKEMKKKDPIRQQKENKKEAI